MSVQGTTWAWDNSGATGSELLVLLAIADASNTEGARSCQSVATLCRMTRLSESTVHRCIKALLDSGAILSEGIDPRYRTVSYRLPGVTGGCQSDTPPVSEGCQTGAQGVSLVTPDPSTTPQLVDVPTGVVTRARREAKSPIPRGWKPSRATLTALVDKFGTVLDVEAERVKFVSHYVNHPERTELDWDARFSAWVASDYGTIMEKRAQAADYDDDMGVPLRRRKVSRVDTMTDEDRARERAAVLARYEREA